MALELSIANKRIASLEADVAVYAEIAKEALHHLAETTIKLNRQRDIRLVERMSA
jgi:hypothetical protein